MRRKHVLVILITSIITLLLNSCSLGGSHMSRRLFNNDEDAANAQMDKILEALQNKDKDSLKALFSKNAIDADETFNEDIDDLFDFFQGDLISYNNWGGPGVEEERYNDQRKKEFYSTYDVETSKQKYRFAVLDFTIDTANPGNVGIYSFYIVLADNTDEQVAYRGDGKYTPGINIDGGNS